MPGLVMQNNINQQDDAKSITHFLSRVFRKVVRLVIGSVSLPALMEILKALYVEEAQKKLIREGSKPTKSAIALITGLDTRVVSSVLTQNLDTTIQNQNVNPENDLIEMWTSDPFFQDPETGDPAALPISGRGRTFQGLVLKAIGRNITVKTVMDRLLVGGAIQVNRDDIDTVQLISKAYLPLSDDRVRHTEIGLLEASRVLGAVVHNMNSDPETRVPQQGRWTYRLAPENYKRFRKRIRELLRKQIKEGELLLEEFEEPTKQPGQLTVGIGWYQWGDHEPEEEEE
ncbi:MAG: DUF6502 family protein [Xanthomonadales bacterium]|nr:DUF6502 family protein [Xanthomonadales bacterium]MDH3923806.1 DUF6502 family protein [Xanthomonadales bacterium]MDH3940535.1 DUF6502 family protein [Xanthomonadales bacterium]MDH4000687.1 DUF6502 family protein [Xanthomonadales bacterium]